jgi:hypothetical protein
VIQYKDETKQPDNVLSEEHAAGCRLLQSPQAVLLRCCSWVQATSATC